VRPTRDLDRRRLVLLAACVWLAGTQLARGAVEEANPSHAQALSGPWRWLEPELATFLRPDFLQIGPWLEPAITFDSERRVAVLTRLELEAALPPAAPVVEPDQAVVEPSVPAAPAEPEVVPAVEEQPAVAPILRQAALDSARLLEAANESPAAAEAFAGVIEAARSNGEDVPLDIWHGLAMSLARSGDAAGSERAFLSGLDASGDTAEQLRFRYDLAGFYRSQGRLLEAMQVIDALQRHAPDSRELAAARTALAASIELAALGLPRGSPEQWPAPPPGAAGPADPIDDALASWPAPLRPLAAPIARILGDPGSARGAAYLGGAALGLLGLLVLLRQRGDIAVAIEYPEELRGIFRVRRRGSRRRLPDTTTEEQIRKGGASTRRQHHMVARETQFQRLFTGRYQIIIDGLLIDPASDEVLGKIHDEKLVHVRKGRTVRVEFDVHPSTCPVDLSVAWGDRPAQEAQVAVPGLIDKPRAAEAGNIRIALPKGTHHILVGCGDRVFDHTLVVTSFRPTSVLIDVLAADAVFKGCPPAVFPYLTGDLPTAARALERDGQAALGYRLLATRYERDGDLARAADFYESAGDPLAAARLRLAQGEFARAASLFEQGESFVEAAEAHLQDGQQLRAGECYERVLDYERAIRCYRECGAIDRWLSALERFGRVFEGAKLALEHGQRPRAIRLLQLVDTSDPDFREACLHLADAFETEGHFDLAAAKLDEHIATYRPGHAPADLYARLASCWEQAGHAERALGVLEDLRRREPTYPNIASRIELLRKQRSASGHVFAAPGARIADRMPTDGASTAFVGEIRYELLEEVGRGGMGVVYRARDTRLGRIVALKRLPEGLRRHHPRALQFFLREAQSAARLNHPNIVTVFDADQQDGHFFITMELLEGQPLHTILRERGQLSALNVIGVARQACRGLEYAHAQGIVHRDIKTANLFATTDGVIKIMDFGLAKVLEEVRGATTVVSGTPYYMSPEQVLGQDVDHRSDLYSLGVTLFELATGRVPFDSGEVAYHHRHTPAPDPRTLRPDLPEPLARLIMKLLAKDPADRHQSASELLAALTDSESE
jgi:tetratricopeptide (TPR) repeat protein/tRNA A-37 threonylcarbamoyl transferase component Bud32